jgi:glycerol-3-phosphate O-acyltransferase
MLAFAAKMLGKRLRGRFRRFGWACVAFGQPVLPGEGPEAVQDLAAELMRRIGAAMPLPPLPLVALALTEAGRPLPREAIVARVAARIGRGQQEAELLVSEGLAQARLRRLVREGPDGIGIVPGERPLLSFYAASVALPQAEPLLRAEPEETAPLAT